MSLIGQAKHKAISKKPLVSRATESEGFLFMVKRQGNLWDKLISEENILLAYTKAKKHKSKYTAVKEFEKNLAVNLANIRKSIMDMTYTTAKYKEKIVFEPKKRTIYILPFYPDRIVQHALINILEPIWLKLFIKDSYACIKDRGMHRASIRTSEFIGRNDYCLKMDIRKFYPSINHDILFDIVKRKIKDDKVLWLVKDVIYSFEGETNVPIGNLTSQWFGNLYMNELDTFVKQKLKIKDYVRYCDDFCLFSNSKDELNRAKYQIIEFLDKRLKLTLSKCDLFPVKRGVDFMGYRHFRGYNLLRKSTAKRVKRRLPAIVARFDAGKMSIDRFRSNIDSTIGWIRWANCHNFMVKTRILEYRSRAMAKFSEIAEENDKNLRKLEGESVRIDDWLDKPIKITNYRVEPSNFKDKYGRTKNRIGFEFYYEGTPRVIFSSASTLLYLIPKYSRKDEPLECKIVKKSDGQYVLE